MKKVLKILLYTLLISSCQTYIDRGSNFHSNNINFNYLENHNEFLFKSKVNAIADKQVFYVTNFSINLPKKIKYWERSNNEFFFEYASKEIIYLNVGYKNKGNYDSWTIRDIEDDELYDKLSSYWDKRKYNENTLKTGSSGRVSKVYSDGRVEVYLYNIKQENFDRYFGLIKSFKYKN